MLDIDISIQLEAYLYIFDLMTYSLLVRRLFRTYNIYPIKKEKSLMI